MLGAALSGFPVRQSTHCIVLHTLEVGISKRSGIMARLIAEDSAAAKSARPGESLHAFGMIRGQQNVVAAVNIWLSHLNGDAPSDDPASCAQWGTARRRW
jgi:hypothetical protein